MSNPTTTYTHIRIQTGVLRPMAYAKLNLTLPGELGSKEVALICKNLEQTFSTLLNTGGYLHLSMETSATQSQDTTAENLVETVVTWERC